MFIFLMGKIEEMFRGMRAEPILVGDRVSCFCRDSDIPELHRNDGREGIVVGMVVSTSDLGLNKPENIVYGVVDGSGDVFKTLYRRLEKI
jgi:hypothetical protein